MRDPTEIEGTIENLIWNNLLDVKVLPYTDGFTDDGVYAVDSNGKPHLINTKTILSHKLKELLP